MRKMRVFLFPGKYKSDKRKNLDTLWLNITLNKQSLFYGSIRIYHRTNCCSSFDYIP